MRYAILSDVHANLEALEVVLTDVERRGPDAVLCLGDFVGYGPDPVACVERLRPRLAAAVVGNHDRAALGRLDIAAFNPYARAAILWTQARLTDGVRRFLEDLPETHRRPAFLAVHGSPRDPVEEYIVDVVTARAGFAAAEFHLCLVGHSHVPGVFVQDGDGITALPLLPEDPLDLRPACRYIINVGSVGQPRDGDPRAAYLWLDEGAGTATLVRLPYPLEVTQAKMEAAGLPAILAERLAYGR
ncbi:MAG: metallophosphoesterase family protein [Armatimonadota bacterium]|nr:metallophosphoesterase family protein [Armatimonadota bacterium]MDR7452184.1 metallophosphoesterase family protein [Armatimonadota bacterium]MDR7468049.1 metallophosphoesterase family protein [Armatimonadota bacterium]MDR7494910.1 metallophosphoesterase family protein [Armatimonadota bacterium]MDR7500360.1 metallophosphoesterase family protein [Armatimonadota bacterium]